MTRKRVLVVGAGPAGLAAAATLLEEGEVDVTVLNLDHVVGGKAKSWIDGDRVLDYGIHFVFGFYKELRKLMARAGVRESDVLLSARGQHLFYEPRDGQVHEMLTSNSMALSTLNAYRYDGISFEEKVSILQFCAMNPGSLRLSKGIEDLDGQCFTAWALDHGLHSSVLDTTLFRFTQDALFNWPHEISAYICIRSIRDLFLSYRNLLYHLVRDGWTTCIWDPIAAYIRSMGGRFVHETKLIRIRHDGDRVAGLDTIPRPAEDRDCPGVAPEEDRVHAVSEPRRWTDFDAVICTLPAASFQALNPGDDIFWGHFSDVHNLTSIAPMGLWLFYDRDLGIPYRVQVNGVDPPLFNVVDLKHVLPRYADRGSVIHLQGQESGFEGRPDAEIRDLAIANLTRVPGFEVVGQVPYQDWHLQRDDRHFRRFLLTEPGTLRFRPQARTPYRNLFLAGDWVRSERDVPCMENAVVTARTAAHAILGEA